MNPDVIKIRAFPDDLACRITVQLKPRNPYGIRICEYGTPVSNRGEASGSERETLYTMFALEITLGGEKLVTAPDSGFSLLPGKAAVFSPGLYRMSESRDYRSRIVFFNEKFPPDFIRQNFKTVPPPNGRTLWFRDIDENTVKWFLNTTDGIFNEATYFPCMSRSMLQDAFLRFLMLDRENMKGFLATAVLSDNGGLPFFMALHATENISNEELARLFGQSLSVFHKQFMTVFGTTPQKWLMDRRLERARVLLVSTSMNVTRICYETGFKDSAHFTRSFRRKYGISPSEARAGHG